MNFIFSDNVCILCFLINVKKPKTTAILSKKGRNKFFSLCFLLGVLCEVSHYTVCYHRSS
jgi:hypothetical protein